MPININHNGNLIVTDDETLTFSMTGAVQVPVGTTGERPAGSNGMIRYNTTTSEFEGYDGATWGSLGSGSSISTTDDLSEGATNLYYTDERVDDRVNALLTEGTNVSLTYDDGAGTLTVALDNTGGLPLANNDTDDLSEGATNLYWTQGRFDTALAASDTGDLAEGSNLYYTDERVDDRVNALLVEGTGITLNYDDGANSLTISSSSGGGGYQHIETLTLGSNSNTFEASTGLSAYRNVRFTFVGDGPTATPLNVEARATAGTWRTIGTLGSGINTNGGIAFGEIINFNDDDGSHMRVATVNGGIDIVNFTAGDGVASSSAVSTGWAIRDEIWDEFRIRLGGGNIVAGSLLRIEGQT